MSENTSREVAPAPRASRRDSLFRTSGAIALFNLVGRLLGFLGDTVKSHYFGAGGLVDAFNVAAAVPTLLNDLLIQSLVNSTFIPVFSNYQDTPAEFWLLSNALLNITSLFFTGVVLLLELCTPLLAHLLNGGASTDMQALTTTLLHITIPVLLVLNISGVLSAVLYAKQRIVLPTVAGMFFNGAILLSAVLFQARLGILALALGLLFGALLQVAALLRGLRGVSWPYRLTLWHPGLSRMAGLFSPILIGLLVEIFVSRPLTYAFASQTGEGGIAWMGYALTLRQVPEGLIATALSITVLVRLSAIPQEKTDLFRDTLAEGLRLAFILIIPSAVGLFLLAQPITALLFQHGSFTARDTDIVAQALRLYLVGLPFSTVDLLLVVAFYARRNTLTPALIGVVTTFVYIGLSKTLLPVMGLYGLMLADSTRFVLHTGISASLLFPLLGGLAEHGIAGTLWKSLLAAAAMAVALSVTAGMLVPGEDVVSKALAVLIPAATGLLVYLATLTVLAADDLRLLWYALPGRRRSEGSKGKRV